ncbi:hypothetical protein [Acinetobacter guillouiae]|uniref:hypothetical protein n=1 Tax=Acinetobacter guillouiae TaxID=106649 RepID=UPI002FD9D55D
MFDPFNDFETNGYLRNFRKDKNLEIVKRFEHAYFEANIDTALDFLASCPHITYADFLKVHHILFSDYYPWAGQDRSITSPNCAIKKSRYIICTSYVSTAGYRTRLRSSQ